MGSMPRLFSLQASEETVCLVIPREKFAKALEQFPELMPKITSNLGRKHQYLGKNVLSGTGPTAATPAVIRSGSA